MRAARAGQRARDQAGELAFDVEETDLPEVEQLRVEVEPRVHVAALHVVGQMIEIVESRTPSGFGSRAPSQSNSAS